MENPLELIRISVESHYCERWRVEYNSVCTYFFFYLTISRIVKGSLLCLIVMQYGTCVKKRPFTKHRHFTFRNLLYTGCGRNSETM
jgi:hypothetical protein